MNISNSIASFAACASISFGVVTTVLSPIAHAQACTGDLNSDGQVNGADLGALLTMWGSCPVAAPAISSVNPNYGPRTGGTLFAVTGTNLNAATGVTVGGVAAAIVSVTPTVITAAAPASATPGPKDVVVTTMNGTATGAGAFDYLNGSVPSWATLVELLPDPAVVTNESMRAAISTSGLAWRVRDTATQVEMLLVPPGTFTMGCTPITGHVCTDASESPTHSVTLTQAFYVGRYEVTQSQWLARMGSNPSYFQGASYPNAANRPVEQVSWNTIQGFLAASGMRLPSEAEWEYACRAGTDTAFNNGSSDDTTVGAIAWYDGNGGAQPLQTHVVGGKAANALGLFDMSGNVAEWVNDVRSIYYYSASPLTNPPGPPSGTNRVFRGGAFNAGTSSLRSSYRGYNGIDFAYFAVGFRVARNP
jgi:formylglycine-generating enzyme required for sulfatase activity